MPAPAPGQDESRDGYIARRMTENDTEDEGGRRAECQLAWNESQDEEAQEGPTEGASATSSRKYQSPKCPCLSTRLGGRSG